MATRSPQTPTFEGAALTLYNAASGDKVQGVRQPTRMLVVNGSGSPVTLTVAVPGNTGYGVAKPDKTFTIGAGTSHILTLLPEYRDPADSNLIALSWSSTTTVTWAVIG
ncbi:hypothetical protein [Microbispora sp. GKU 823]|uniref:hypothetical protein n=1 Tax=Microbispora sp. GKU 823 TaxID=1652100 RepID=UPI0009A43B85|nr:hypothetical protein [Microbispora sp. GKU 823]OPG13624.1 hypothetical protein B1L11_06455 [Microbispora sp. GKU 823]